jgi:putative Ca2+/H+ antiporter (TMEM165/GDT1 family)
MEWKLFATVFTSIFIAELADKTQLVTLLFASDRGASKLTVFLGAAFARALTSAIAVAVGGLLSQVVSVRMMSIVAGVGFMLIGAWTLFHGISSN